MGGTQPGNAPTASSESGNAGSVNVQPWTAGSIRTSNNALSPDGTSNFGIGQPAGTAQLGAPGVGNLGEGRPEVGITGADQFDRAFEQLGRHASI